MPRVNLEEKIEKEPYKSILAMLKTCHDNGLKPMHFRYELGKEERDKEGNIYRAGLKIFDANKGDKTDLAKRIKMRLEINRELYTKDIIRDNDKLQYSKQLSEKLAFLLSNNVIEKTKKGAYVLNKDFYKRGIRDENIDVINTFDLDEIRKNPFNIPSIEFERIILYGFTEKVIDRLKAKDKTEISKILKKIQDFSDKILELKIDKLTELWKGELHQFREKTNSERIKRIIDDDIVGDTFLDSSLFTIFYDTLEANACTIYKDKGKLIPDAMSFYEVAWSIIKGEKTYLSDYSLYEDIDDILTKYDFNENLKFLYITDILSISLDGFDRRVLDIEETEAEEILDIINFLFDSYDVFSSRNSCIPSLPIALSIYGTAGENPFKQFKIKKRIKTEKI